MPLQAPPDDGDAYVPLNDDAEASAQPHTPPAAVFKPRAVVASVLVALATCAALPDSLRLSARRGASLFTLSAALWASDAVPAWVVGSAVPPLATALQLGAGDSPPERGVSNLSSMADPVVFLLLASFALGAALKKHGLDARLAAVMLRRASAVGPRTLIAMVLCVCAALSAVVGNACAAVVVLLLCTPLLRSCPRSSRFPQCCVTAVALGANIGGMLTPVSSAQNAVALGQAVLGGRGCSVGFGDWVAATLPLCVLYVFAAHVLLFAYWRPTLTELPATSLQQDVGTGALTPQARAVVVITASTVVSWACFPHVFAPLFGDIGVLSLCPIALLWGSGLMTKAEFLSLDWSIVILLGGGSTLGRSVETSGLLDHIASALRQLLAGWTPAAASAVYAAAMLLASNCISHTVAAMTFLPLVADAADQGSVAATVMCAVMACTSACMLPISSLPNMLAFASTDVAGQPFLEVSDLLKLGLAFEAVVYSVTTTAGFALASSVLQDACQSV
jgi:phosphate transporter